MVNYSRPGVTGKMIEAHLARQGIFASVGRYDGRPYRARRGGPSEADIYAKIDTLLKYPVEEGHPDAARYAEALTSLQALVETFSPEAKKARADLLQWREAQRRSYAQPLGGPPTQQGR
jgi:hypothetical protein